MKPRLVPEIEGGYPERGREGAEGRIMVVGWWFDDDQCWSRHSECQSWLWFWWWWWLWWWSSSSLWWWWMMMIVSMCWSRHSECQSWPAARILNQGSLYPIRWLVAPDIVIIIWFNGWLLSEVYLYQILEVIHDIIIFITRGKRVYKCNHCDYSYDHAKLRFLDFFSFLND